MSKTYNNGIITTAGFQFNANMPLDDRLVVDTLDDLLSITSYDGMIVYVKSKERHYTKTNDEWIVLASTSSDNTDTTSKAYVDAKVSTLQTAVDNKVSKVEGNNSHSQVYAAGPKGEEKTIGIRVGAKAGFIPVYNTDDSLLVQETPTQSKAATSKQYVDTKVSEVRSATIGKVSKVDNTNGVLGDGHSVVYAAKVDGQDSYFPLTFGRYKEGGVLAYDENGYIEVNVPQSIADDGKFAVNKEWVRNYDRDIIKSPNFIRNASYATSTDPNYGVMTAYGDNKAQGFASAAFGELNYIEGDKISGSPNGGSDSLAAGARNRITGNGGKAALLGLSNIATASCTFAGNRYNTVKAVSAFSLGERNQVAGKAAGALGKGLTVTNDKQVAVGSYNAPNESAVFIVGNGCGNRQNAMTVQKDGTLTLGGHFDENYTEVLDTSKAAKYLYKSTAGDVNLYKICDCQTEDEETLIRSWLINAKFTKDGTEYIIDEKSVIEPGTDARKNLVVKDNKVIVLCVVESIDPYNMPTMTEFGVYVNPDYIDAVQFSKWIDEPYTTDMSGYVTDEQLESITNAIDDINVGKLDQAAGNESYSQAYTVDSKGNQTTTPLSFDTMAGTIPRRLVGTNHEGLSEDGHINVPYEPTGAGHATSKTYVDNQDDAVKDLVAACVQQEKTKADYSRLYGVKRSGEQEIVNIVSGPDVLDNNTMSWPTYGGIVARLGGETENGQIIVPADPTAELSATSKKYVDKKYSYIYDSRSLKDIKGFNVVQKVSEPQHENTVNSVHSAVFGTGNWVHEKATTSLVSGNHNKISKGNGKNAVFGLRNLADADTAFIANRYNVSKGLASFTLGERNQVNAQNSGALGTRLITNKASQLAVGQLNAAADTAMFVVGNGSDYRSNAMTVRENGEVTVGGQAYETTIYSDRIYTDDFNIRAAGKAPNEKVEIGAYGSSVCIIPGWTCNSGNILYESATFIKDNITTGTDPQINIENLSIKAGHTYSISFKIQRHSADFKNINYWLAIVDDYDSEAVTKVYNENISLGVTTYVTKTCEITASKNGVLRLGLSNFTSGSASGEKFRIANIKIIDNNAEAVPVYNYKSEAGPGNHTETLYRICDVPCDCTAKAVKALFLNKTINTTVGCFKFTEDNIDSLIFNDRSDWKDITGNFMIMAPHPTSGQDLLLACIVDRIDPIPGAMDVSELGLYVNACVTSIPGIKWVDRIFASEHKDGSLIIHPDYIFDTKEVSTDVINTSELISRDASVNNLDVSTVIAEKVEVSGRLSSADLDAVNVSVTGDIVTNTVKSDKIHATNTFTDALCVTHGISYGTEEDMEQLEDPKLGQLFIIVDAEE